MTVSWINTLLHYGLFLLETITIVGAILITFGGLLSLKSQQKKSVKKIDVKQLNKHYQSLTSQLSAVILNDEEKRKLKKQVIAKQKSDKKQQKNAKTQKKIFVLDFTGDIKASAVESLREMITAVLTVVKSNDEVLLKLESAGGMVHSYGLAASQLQRIKEHGIKLTVVIDKIAASGGYMMACVADRIIAAPFAIIGSIGVVAQLPNFNKLLQKNDIDFEQITAGEHKRTLTLFGKNTKEDRDKFQEDVNQTHNLFKQFISKNRPQININKIATGEHWYATDAINLELVDHLQTSDSYLFAASKKSAVFELSIQHKPSIIEKFTKSVKSNLLSMQGVI